MARVATVFDGASSAGPRARPEKDECADDSEPRASGPSGSLEDVVGTMVPWRTATAFNALRSRERPVGPAASPSTAP